MLADLAQQAMEPLEDTWLEALNPDDEPYWRFLYLLAREVRPAVSVVIGTWKGEDVAHLALGYPEGQVLGIDPQWCPAWTGVVVHCPNAQFLVGEAHAVNLPDWVKNVGIVFQDSTHHYLESVKEWERFIPLMVKGGYWVCDDITPSFWDPLVDPPGLGMVQYFESRPGEKKLFPGLHLGNVIGVVRI